MEHLLDQQLADGGWNCATRTGQGQARLLPHQHPGRGSVDDVRRAGGTIDVTASLRRGQEFFLDHRLYQSHRTGAVAIRGEHPVPGLPRVAFRCASGSRALRARAAPATSGWRTPSRCVRHARRVTADGRPTRPIRGDNVPARATGSEPVEHLPRAAGPAVVGSIGERMDEVVSTDGTAVSFSTVGGGPGLVVLPGNNRRAHHYAAFASELFASYTIHVIDRRGRGLGGTAGRPTASTARSRMRLPLCAKPVPSESSGTVTAA